MPSERVVQYTQTAANCQTGSRFAAKWCCDTGDLKKTICYDKETHTGSQFARDSVIVYNILTIDFRSFHALRTWKVHVVLFSYHATHFHSLLTCAPLDFRYVNARFDFRHTIVISHIAYAGVTIPQRP